MVVNKTRGKKIKLSAEQIKKKEKEKKENKIKRQYAKSIEKIFKNSGFQSLSTENKQFDIGNRPNCELDHCFVLENIIIICEQTTGKRDSSHILKKQETATAISKNKKLFLSFLDNNFPNQFNKKKYGVARWKIFYLYFSKYKIDIDEEDKQRYDNLKFVDIGTYNYFVNMSQCIKKSFRFEILRYLEIGYEDFGKVSPGAGSPLPNRLVSIIYPNDVTGLSEGVGIVSFMMSPEELIKTSYVLRKDSWEEKIGLYQRLITEKRIKSVRKFIVDTKRTFFNNIIVGLPNTIEIINENGDNVDINELDQYRNCKMKIANGFNSISIIDGQHRVYAYYENDIVDQEENEVALLRSKLNLLVTGIIFPKEWDNVKRRKFQSDIFLQINRNAKNVDKDLLIHIETTKDPFSSMSIARLVLIEMNKSEPFKNMFQLSLVEKAQIKVSSIIQYALSSLVNPIFEANGLYKYWILNNKYDLDKTLDSELLLNDYVKYCTTYLTQYFCAIKSNYKDQWNDPKSLILKVISLNGFIIAYNHTLTLTNGPQKYKFYYDLFERDKIDFSKEKFPYSGS